MRRQASYLARLSFLILCFFFLSVPNANAYIDPGSGSFIFQVTIGTLLAATAGVKFFWRRIRSRLGRRSEKRQPTSGG